MMLQQRLARSLQQFVRQSPPSRPLNVHTTPFHAATPKVAPATSQQLLGRRWYSEDTKEPEKAEEQMPTENSGEQDAKASKDAAKKDPVQKELDAKKKEVIDVTDRLMRQVAEYRNLQEQTRREIAAAKDFALQKFAKDLLESVDNLDRALENVPKEKLTDENKDLVNLHSGLKMTETILMSTLKRHGMEQIDPSAENEPFDPNKHEAIFQAPQPDKKDGTVFYTQQKGFIYNGRVLRAAKVGVVKNS